MSEKYLGENSTPLLINQIKENCTQKRSTLPIASLDELGNVYQYTGASSGSLVHNYFYECVVTSENPTTYGWQNINIQPTAETPTATTTTFDNTTSELQATNVQDAIDEVEGRVDTAESDIDAIEAKIPSTATSSNKLVDHDSLGTAAFKDFTPNVAPNNHGLVESNAVYNAINTALSSVYTPRGDLTCAELTSSLLIAANVGNIYEMSDSGTTSNLFLQGAGQTIHVGDNVGVIQTGVSEYKFNLMANAFDLTDYQKKDLTQAVESATTVEGALSALSTNKADKVSSATNGDFAGLDANGNLTDSGKKASDFATAEGLANEVEVRATLGAHNLLPFPFDNMSGTYYSVPFTIADDGLITASGTASSSGMNMALATSLSFDVGEYKVKLFGSISGGVARFRDVTAAITQGEITSSVSEIRFSITEETKNHRFAFYFNASPNTEFSVNGRFAIFLANDPYDEYTMYAPTNAQLLSYRDNGVLGAKNFCTPTFLKGNYTSSGFVSNGYVASSKGFPLKAGQYIVSWSDLASHATATLRLYLNYMTDETHSTNNNVQYGSGNPITITVPSDGMYAIQMNVQNAGANPQFSDAELATLNSSLMVRLATDTDSTYQPYAMTNKELTERVAELVQYPTIIYTGTTYAGLFDKIRETFGSSTPYDGFAQLICDTSDLNFIQGLIYRRGDRIAGTLFPPNNGATKEQYFIFTRTSAGQDYIGKQTLTLTQLNT